MSTNFKRKKQYRAEEVKSCFEELSRKTTKLENDRQSIIESLTNSVNQNCLKFVIWNKKATLEKLNRKRFDEIKDFGKLGFLLLCLNIFYLNFRKISYIVLKLWLYNLI